jgi:cell division protein FtsN
VPKEKSGSKLWILLLLLFIAIGVGGYFAYPKIAQLAKKTDSNQVEMPVEEPEPIADAFDDEEPTADDPTDISNALNPDVSQQTTTSTPQTQTQTTTAPAATSQSFSSSAGSGRYLVIVGSFTTNAAAERYAKRLQTQGLNCEVIDAGNQRFRVSAASYNTWAEAAQVIDEMKSRLNRDDVWVVRRR